MDDIVISLIADIHIGAMDAKTLLAELISEYIEKLEELPRLDLIVILGDTLDHKLYLNSAYSKAYFAFFKMLCLLASERNAKVRVIKGTDSHDNEQLDNLSALKTLCDLKVFSNTDKEVIYGMNVLYIPEEYQEDNETYYSEFFNDEYDFIFGHGLVKEAAFVAHNQESEITMKNAPTFDTDKLLSITKGGIYFGHIHTHRKIKKRFYYVGSFSRWAFGEEADKGHMLINYDPRKPDDIINTFIKNTLAREFITINVTLENDSIDICINSIKELIKNNLIDKLRIKIIISDKIENPSLLTNIINETFGKLTNVKIIITSSIKEIKRKVQNEQIERLLDEYGFIFDKSMVEEEKISKFIEKKYGRNISVERMKKYLYDKISD